MEAKRRNLVATSNSQSSSELGDQENKNYYQRLETEPFPPRIKKKLLEEIRKLNNMSSLSMNHDIQEQYVEKLMSLP
jgi:ATP-dependent Lon protease